MEVRQTSLDTADALAQSTRSDAHLLVVADGVGGQAGGRVASGTAVEALTEYIAQTTGVSYGLDVALEEELLGQLERAVRHSHARIKSHFPGSGTGPATTLTMVTLTWPRAYVVHVGDSRGYYLRRGRLKQFTQDQTMAELLMDEGVMSEEQADGTNLHNVLASAVGGTIKPVISLLDLQDQDWIVLCSDGLTKHVDDDAIRTTLESAASAEAACGSLVQQALDGGGSDNITVIVARCSATG